MRVVAGQAAHSAGGVGVTPAEGEGQARRASELRVRRRALDHGPGTDDVTIGARGDDGLGRCGRHVDDGAVGEIRLDRPDMVRAGSMTPLAADARVAGLGTGPPLRRWVAIVPRL